MATNTSIIVLVCVLAFFFLILVYISTKPKRVLARSLNHRKRACEAMRSVAPGTECRDPMCADTLPCVEKSRALSDPSSQDCDNACIELHDREVEGVNICDFEHCRLMDRYFSECHPDCSIDQPQACKNDTEYAEVIEHECANIVPGQSGYDRCVAACHDLTGDGAQADNACLIKPGFCATVYKDTCHPCAYEEMDRCNDAELEKLVQDCDVVPEFVDLPFNFKCASEGGYNFYEASAAAPVVTVSTSMLFNGQPTSNGLAHGIYRETENDRILAYTEDAALLCHTDTNTIATIAQQPMKPLPVSYNGVLADSFAVLPYVYMGLYRTRTSTDMKLNGFNLFVGVSFKGTINNKPISRMTVIVTGVVEVTRSDDPLPRGIHDLIGLNMSAQEAVIVPVGADKRLDVVFEEEVPFAGIPSSSQLRAHDLYPFLKQ